MIKYIIEGGQPVVGEITCLGAKNFATKAMVAALLSDSPTYLDNIPPIGDVEITTELLCSIGAKVEKIGDNTLKIDASSIKNPQIPMPDSGSNRIPILLLGALLNRFHKITVPALGGCNIGKRNVDFHLKAIEEFGGKVEASPEGYTAHIKKTLKGTRIQLPYPSVGATETCLYLGVLAEGWTLISNAAIEPEIIELITMLRSMGAIIFTSSGRDIRIEGVKNLSGTRVNILGDRIEAASWACLACASEGEITIHGIRPDILGNFLSYFRRVGGGFNIQGNNSIKFFRQNKLRPEIIETDVYPGFSTDWQQPFAVLLTQADGTSIIHETVYENRFGYLNILNKLGAKTQLTNHCLGSTHCRYRDTNHQHSAIISGPTPLAAAQSIEIPDLRAGLAYVIAAAIAKGTTVLEGIYFLERGYGNIVPRLETMNLNIKRVTT